MSSAENVSARFLRVTSGTSDQLPNAAAAGNISPVGRSKSRTGRVAITAANFRIGCSPAASSSLSWIDSAEASENPTRVASDARLPNSSKSHAVAAAEIAAAASSTGAGRSARGWDVTPAAEHCSLSPRVGTAASPPVHPTHAATTTKSAIAGSSRLKYFRLLPIPLRVAVTITVRVTLSRNRRQRQLRTLIYRGRGRRKT